MYNDFSMRPKTNSAPKLVRHLYNTCMQDLDTVGWHYGFSYGIYGVKLGVRVNDPKLLEKFRLSIPFACRLNNLQNVDCLFSVISVVDHNTKLQRFNLYWNHALFSQKLTITELLAKFKAFSSIAIAELCKQKLFIHAGVVGWNNKAILIPGKSTSGKSTLVAELVKNGATYYSDEFAIINKQGYVTPYAKPLSLRDPVTQQQHDVPIKTIGGKTGRCKLPIGLVIYSEFKKSATWNPKPLSLGMGILHLLESTHSAQIKPRRAIDALQQALSKATLLQSFRGEAGELAPTILNRHL